MAESKKEVKEETCTNIPDSEQRFAVLNCVVGSTENEYNYSPDLLDLTGNVPAPQLVPNAIVDLTLNMPSKSNYPNEAVFVDGTVLLDSDIRPTNRNTNVSFKTNGCKKHKIPDMLVPAISEDCSPSRPKVAKVKSAELCADFSNISSSNSTITSENHTFVNDITFHNFPGRNMDVRNCNENSPLDLTLGLHYQVLDMFPQIEYNYLMRLCSEQSDINEIINILLETNDYPREKNIDSEASNINSDFDRTASFTDLNAVKESSTVSNLDGSQDCQKFQTTEQIESVPQNTQLEFLIQVLPDADRSFLESKSTLEGSKLLEYIDEALESKNYPKIEVKVENSVEKNNDELGLYTTAFNIDNFLKIFPEPVKYFMDKNRKCESSIHAVEFLKRRYQHQIVKVIDQVYKKHGYNMSRTCEELDNAVVTRATKRQSTEIRMPKETNLLFLQEACFVEHKSEIISYINSKAETKKLDYERAKMNGELIECGCCFEQCLFEDCAACNEGDLFCKSCIKKSAEVRIGDGLNTFPCLLDCGAEFSLQLLQNLLDANIFSRLIKRIQLEEVRAAEIEGLEVCPFCEFATIPPPETNIFSCLNPECLKESCRKCHKVSHIPQRCEEVEDDDQARARKYIEDEMTRALVRECYKCKKSFIKVDGCNKMTCTCGAIMCYICRQPIKDYKHFNGPGGSDANKCPLYSTDKVLHVDAVKAVAKQALENVNTNNPSLKLKHDPTQVLPTSAKSFLPPGVQENAFALVQRLNQRNNPHNNEFPAVQCRNNVETIIDNVARNLNGNQVVRQRVQMPFQRFNNEYPHQWRVEHPNQLPDLQAVRLHNYQALQQFERVVELVRRRHERGNLPENGHN